MNHTPAQPRLTAKQARPGWMRHFAHPRGLPGRLVGQFMAVKNASINAAAVEMLGIQPTDSVLEIGYGPGDAIARLAERVPQGAVCGIDISHTMQRLASRRNRTLVRAGRVQLYEAGAESIPFPAASFERVVAINNFHIWDDRAAGLSEIHRVLKPGGLILLVARTAPAAPGKYVPPGLDDRAVDRAVVEIEAAGFEDLQVERRDAGRQVVGIRGIRSRSAHVPEDPIL